MIDAAWKTYRENQTLTYHEVLGSMINRILKEAVVRRTFDNVTAVIIAFKNFKDVFDGKQEYLQIPSSLSRYTPDIKI